MDVVRHNTVGACFMFIWNFTSLSMHNECMQMAYENKNYLENEPPRKSSVTNQERILHKMMNFFFCKSIDAKFVSYKFYVSHNKRCSVFYCSFSFVFFLHSYEVISPIIIIITGCVRNFYVFRKSNDVAPARKKNALCKKKTESIAAKTKIKCCQSDLNAYIDHSSIFCKPQQFGCMHSLLSRVHIYRSDFISWSIIQ